jgi:hypothetical protein
MIFSAPNAPIEGVQVLLEHHKQQSPPLGSSLPWTFESLVIDRSTLTIVDAFKKRENKMKLNLPPKLVEKTSLCYFALENFHF